MNYCDTISRVILACLVVLLPSCVQEKLPEREVEEVITTPANGKSVVINASNPDTRTYGTTTIQFNKNDVLSVFDTEGANNAFAQPSGVESATVSATFEGEVTSGSEPQYAVYPYSAASSISDGVVTLQLPNHYKPTNKNSVLRGMNVSIGQIQKNGSKYSVTLKNLCGILGVNIPSTAIGLKNIMLTSLEGKPLAGNISFSWNNGEPQVISVSDGVPSVDFDVMRNSTDALTAGSFYFSVLPGSYTGIRLTLTLLNGKKRIFESTNTLNVARNSRFMLRDLSLEDLQSAPEGGLTLNLSFPKATGDAGTYCPTLYRTVDGVTSYLPGTAAKNQGQVYYFDQGKYSYPFWIKSKSANGTLLHAYNTTYESLYLQGGTDGAGEGFIMTPPIPGKVLSSVRLAVTTTVVANRIRISTEPDKSFSTLASGTYVQGAAGASSVLGSEISLSPLNPQEGQPFYIYFNYTNAVIPQIVLKYGEGSTAPRELPDYYSSHIATKKVEVSSLSTSQADGFVFWTDTHISANAGNSPLLIRELLTQTGDTKVFWGGDAVPAYTTDPAAAWSTQVGMFDEITGTEGIYPVHGNHDLTCRESAESSIGVTLSKSEVSLKFRDVAGQDAVYNTADAASLYYYVDNAAAGIRYIVMDVYDQFQGSDVYWGVLPGVSQTQMDWVFGTAVMNAPENCKLVFLSHFAPGFNTGVSALNAALAALSAHEDYGTYSFSSRPDLKLMLVLGGHQHHDMQLNRDGVWYVQTLSDACYPDFTRSPFAPSVTRSFGTVYEQGLDYVSIAPDYLTITMIRAGIGGNRVFNMQEIEIAEGQTVQLTSSGSTSWRAYDSTSTYNSGSWSLTTTVATVSSSGLVTGVSEGYAVVAAKDASGNLELFKIRVVHSDYTDLSAAGKANCYIVSSAGDYKFDGRVKGGGSQSVGTPASASVLWESTGVSTPVSEGVLVKDVFYSGGYVYFSTPETFGQGNAVIVVKDSGGNILWSWHIWLTATAVGEVSYGNGAGTVMNRNLGSRTAAQNSWTSRGLLYQWGRKDPFPGAASISADTESSTTSNAFTTVASTSSTGTLAYSTAHPMTFITRNTANGDWLYTGTASTDNTRWASSKTVNDPCPYGWRVPDGGDHLLWEAAKGSSLYGRLDTWNSSYYSLNMQSFLGTAGAAWFPAGGYRNGENGTLQWVGKGGFWWACATGDGAQCGMALSSEGNTVPITYGRADAQSIRCVKE